MVDLAHFGGPQRCLGALGGILGCLGGACLAHKSPRGGPGGCVHEIRGSKEGLGN